MPIIALLTDRLQTDFYSASVKGKLLGLLPNAQIIDLAHDIKPHNIAQAAFVLKYSYLNFPEGSVFVVGVGAEPSIEMPVVVAQKDNRYFVGTDIGIFSLALEFPDKMVKSTHPKIGNSTFIEMDVLADHAAELANGCEIDKLGEPLQNFFRKMAFLPPVDDSTISGQVIYIDSYKNVITNIDRELFDEIGRGRNFEITVQSNRNKITRLNTTYNQSSKGDLLAVFNTLNLLEVAVYEGFAAELFNLGHTSIIRVRFYDKKNSKTGFQGFDV